MKQKYALFDRDGTLLYEPQETHQIDNMEVFKILDGVIENLRALVEQGYKLVLVSNQDGIGTKSFPMADFAGPQEAMLVALATSGIKFERIFICPHFEQDGCDCRKPQTSLVTEFLEHNDLDKENSFVCGDRDTDRQFAENLGLKFVSTRTNDRLIINKE